MFVHLHCHSHYSFLRGVASPAEIVAAAAREKMPAVALTDTDGLYAAVPFYRAAREAGVRPIIGAVLPAAVLPDEDAPEGNDAESFPLLLLAATGEGYANLCRLVTHRQLDNGPLAGSLLDTRRDGLIALYAPARSPAEGQMARAGRLKEIFGGNLYLEAHHFPAGGGGNLRAATALGRAVGASLAATNNVHFLSPEEFLHHRVVNAIRTGRLAGRVAPPEIADPEAWFKPAEAMRKTFADYPEALRSTLEIAERVELELKFGGRILPSFPVPEGETAFSYLWQLCFRGARRRYHPPGPEVIARLASELEVIDRMGLAPYFLLVWDIVREARRRGIPAAGRGSAASSMVSYCLGISRVCPLRWGLYFERFLNEQRGDTPDIDLDLCGARRDELLEYVYRRWGASRVAMIGSFVTMHARLALREVAKTFGVAPGEVNRFTRRLPHRPVREILEAIRVLPQCRDLPAGEEPWRTILAVALRLDDIPRHMGIHPCGTVIAPAPLAGLVPLEMAAKGIVVTQYDMNAVEAMGLVKMDLLGQRGLTTISLALGNIERSTGRKIDFDAIAEHDRATGAMLSAGRTMGVFQIESPGMRALLRAMRARTMEDLSAALALIRPGAAEYGAKETFLRRLRRQEPVRYAHPALEPILRDTLGVCIYQEQVMRIARTLGSLSLAEADLVRRASAKFADERERARLRTKFLKAAAGKGLEGENLERVWQMVEKFAGFGFCKAHAATYADLSYRIAFLKAHYPAEFLAAMCSSGAGFYHVSAYVEEAKRWAVPVLLPSANRSRAEYTVEATGREGKRAIRIGLMQVKGLRAETIAAIVAGREREGNDYRSLDDFLGRVPASRDELAALIRCGALDEIPEVSVRPGEIADVEGRKITRPMRLWQLHLALARRAGRAPAGALLFPDAAAPAAGGENAIPPLADYDSQQRLACELELLEVAASGHPLDRVRRNGEAWSNELGRRIGQRVELLGWLITFRAVGTKDSRNMMFLTLEDQRGVYEAVLFPNACERCGALVFETRMLRVGGRVEDEAQIHCEKIEPVKP
ncbi:MAG TPA: DNA polymerase III subunit alpha [Candidatus Dormibacteraeota bacterium]|nr:DNA polymerase III subunit alpha [Candidatus Dormibacteraeota bacterium]